MDWEGDFMSWANDMLDKIDQQKASMPTERPIHSDKQVLSFEDLIVGNTYLEYCATVGLWDKIILTCEPYLEDGAWKIKAKSFNNWDQEWYEQDYFLSDKGVIPYENGKWNANNYLEAI